MRCPPRCREALADICDTFVPGSDGAPSASAAGVPDAFLDIAGSNLRAGERRQLELLLALWDTRLVTLAGGGGFRRFRELPPDQRERVLLSWCDSFLPHRRAAFQALRKAVASLYYMLPSPTVPNPVWSSLRYPGPPGRPAHVPPKAIEPYVIDGETTLDCDVCVVGSGAGGGTAAGVLAEAGLDVVVLEAGGYLDDEDFDGAELAGYQRLYLGSAAVATVDQSVGLLAGSCLGGGTVVNFSTSFRTPDEIRQEWAGYGLDAVAAAEYTDSLDAVWERLGVNTDHSRPSPREAVMKRGLEALGWHVGAMPRNVRGCDQGHLCGYSPFGCLAGAKQSTTKTWLTDAWRRGARILVRTRAERVVVRAGRAEGVEARTREGHKLTVRARAVVVAAGALHTPALLRRSGLDNPNIGRHLRLHPVTGVAGVMEEEVRPWEGAMQAVYSDELSDLHAGYGVKLESAPFHPSVLAMFAPWRGAGQHAELMGQLPHLVPIGVLLRDSSAGSVDVDRHGEPVVRYRLNDFDIGHLRTGLDGAAQVLEAAGARTIFSAHSKLVAYEPGGLRSRQDFLDQADRCGWTAGRCVFVSFHIMGSARMGGSARDSACNPEGQTWEVRDLYVCDASTFPTASGVNPMISIEALAHLNASRLAQTLAATRA